MMNKDELLQALKNETDPAILKAVEMALSRKPTAPLQADFNEIAQARWGAEDRRNAMPGERMDEDAD